MTPYIVAIFASLVACCAALFARSLFMEVVSNMHKDRGRAAHERELHAEQVARLMGDIAAERSEWAQERSVLLNRIQDPAAGVASSLAYLPPPVTEPGGLDVEYTR